ncbi:hypothetical protein SAMN06297129_3494 [Pseudooceanicola antarcticus]|uniref:Uncharacterized protein n=1 Tax=Pseudooceanicola antarcticus TaxID=1247613 RepID=A0A285JD68_9RHOB|nr:hypothetical protein [Pseudooceanicola antarcticus]PJE30956.1 hypothetical protein CVM39_05800 [Pseudooceanicola antarcticus]SNY58033.1 hypothetical protein SAMN06297129_3494 [Pseudooceanicola antarcticus]
MKQTRNEILRDLWSKGIWLQEAWRAYAAEEKLNRHRALYAKSAIEMLATAPQPAEDASPMAKFGALFKGPQDLLAERAEVDRDMQDDLRRFLYTGQLVALGFEPPRKEASSPLEIPAAYWPKTHSPSLTQWGANTLKHASLIFVDVRIVSRPQFDAALLPASAAPVQTGRPPVNKAIKRTCQELITAGKIDTSLSMKAHYPMIREHLAQRGIDLPIPPEAINDETIRKTFSPLFKDLKEANKQ